MIRVRVEGLKDIDEKFSEIIEQMPEIKRKYHEKMAVYAENEVRKSIGGRKVAGWQEGVVGSKGGYAAVRPARNRYQGKYSVGHITNAINNGHAIRNEYTRAGTGMGSRGRRNRNGIRVIKHGFVKGLHFYAKATEAVEKKAVSLANDMVKDIERQLNGL